MAWTIPFSLDGWPAHTYYLGILVFIWAFHRRATAWRVEPKCIPWVGVRAEFFAKTRACWRELWDTWQNLEKGYVQYSKRSKPFLTPNISYQPEVVLPPEHIKWLVDQPDDVLSIQKVLIEAVQFNYTSPRSWKFKRPFHIESLNKMRLDLLTPDIVDEIALCIDRIFGTDTKEWTEVGLSIPMWETITRVTTRVFVGVDLAHDDTYIHYSASFAMSLGQQSGMITMLTPDLLKPIFGPLMALPCRYYDWRCSQYLVPLIQSHLAAAAKASEHEIRKADMLQLMARCAVKSSDALDRDPRSLCSRLLALNFVGIHTSSITAMNAMLDIWSAPPHVAAALREEAATVLREHDGVWTKAAVGKLVLLDSTLRESMRVSAFKGRGVERLVIKKGGVVLPDGTYLPKGTKIGMPVSEIHRDATFYEDPRKFVFDRFVGKAELGLVNTTDTFLGFGHGRHACPGRFFSAHELKLMFAYILLNYDLRHLDERPKNTTLSDFSLAPDIDLFVKRRERSAHLD